MNRNKTFAAALLLVLLLVAALPTFALADAPVVPEVAAIESQSAIVNSKAFGSAIAIGIAAAAGAIAMGIVVARSAESTARQPEAAGNIRSAMMLGLVFIETTIIYALLAVILIIFVL